MKPVAMKFTLRADQNGLRPVFPLGNTSGSCPYNCRFCGVKKSRKVTPSEAMQCFNNLYSAYAETIKGPYHPVIYNQGNVTSPREFSREVLEYVLDRFHGDPHVRYVSLNSRERDASTGVLDFLVNKHLSYPIHFILGLESFSPRMPSVFGKNTCGELERFVLKLQPYNKRHASGEIVNDYVFGLDVNLVFLPELYLDEGDCRDENISRIREGMTQDLRRLLDHIDRDVPVEINIHPFYRVNALPYESADLIMLLRFLPRLQEIVEHHNQASPTRKTHLFVGVEGDGYNNEDPKEQIREWTGAIDEFNRSGRIVSSW